MAKKLRPLWTPGGGLASARPAGVPTLVNGAIPNGVGYFEDFHTGSYSTSAVLTSGHPNWFVTHIAGTGLAGNAASSTGGGLIRSGSSANDVSVIDQPNFNYALGTANGGTFLTSTSYPWLAQFRFTISGQAGAITNGNFGVGLAGSSLAYGSDWFTDPDVTLDGTTSLVLTRHSGAYAGASTGVEGTTGALMLRYYETSSVDDGYLSLVTTPANGSTYKVELYWSPTGTGIGAWVNGTYIGEIPITGAQAFSARLSWGAKALGAAYRQVVLDSFYQEIGQASAR